MIYTCEKWGRPTLAQRFSAGRVWKEIQIPEGRPALPPADCFLRYEIPPFTVLPPPRTGTQPPYPTWSSPMSHTSPK